MFAKDTVLKAIDGFSNKKIMIIGDIIADEYIYGLTSRVSREAPVLILKFDSQTIFLGSAGNAINNVRELGAEVIPVGVIGEDSMGRKLSGILNKKGVNTDTIVRSKDEHTTTKTRILAGGLHTTKQQVIRIDKENAHSYSDTVQSEVLNNIKNNIGKVDGVIISDYANGVVTDEIIDFISDYAKKGDKVITVDSRHNLFKFKNVTAITPNEPEAEELLHISLEKNDHIHYAAKTLRNKVKSKCVLITRGKKGMVLCEKGKELVDIPIYGSDEVADVTGAGDTVISTFTLGLVASLSAVNSAKLSNLAGGIVVMKSGTAVVTIEELKNAVISFEG